MGNIYHILHRRPAVKKGELPVYLEELAEAVIRSGRLRLDMLDRLNFIRFFRPVEQSYYYFSYRELYDPALLPRTELMVSGALGRSSSGTRLKEETAAEILRMQKELEKFSPILPEEEMQIARLVVQCAEPVVIRLALAEMTEIFVTTGHDVGELLDVVSWKTVGSASGLQRMCGYGSVLISCGGNPLAKRKKEDKDKEYGDGFPSLARMLVIGGQEFGHYAEIIRDAHGTRIGRFSANAAVTRATPAASQGRKEDMETIKALREHFNSLGLAQAYHAEQQVEILESHNVRGIRLWFSRGRARSHSRAFLQRCRRHNRWFVDGLTQGPHKASALSMALQDTLFNLTPSGDCYRTDNPRSTEAIICAEALARMPQQVVKWGHEAIKLFCPNLYSLYYEQVIPACAQALQNATGQTLNPAPDRAPSSLLNRLKYWLIGE